MGKSYYYFAASLPMINFEDKPPFTVEEFLVDCLRLLSDKDDEVIERILSGRIEGFKTSSATLNKWIEFEKNFCNELAFDRAQRAGKDPLSHIRGDRYPDPFLKEIVEQADRAVNPLEAQKVVDKARWNYADTLLSGNFYNLEYIVLYGVRLKILERYHEIATPKGRELFEEIKNVSMSPKGVEA